MSNNPYIGPRTFKEDERDRFYGREREANELLARVLSEQEIVFYAQSGAGKSSLVNTCLIPDLKKKSFEVLLGRVGGDAPAGLEVENIFVFNLLRSMSTSDVNVNTLANQNLSEFLVPTANVPPASEGRGSKRRALIIDQFEEIFSTHHEAWEKRTEFFEQLAQALEADPRLRVILVMREDYIASLDPYAGILPNQFRTRYYMQRLEQAAALKAVKEPVKGKDFSRPYEAGAAEKLVDDLRTIKVIKPDGTPDVGVGQFVEPLYLQVICYELWNNLPADGTTITRKNVDDAGDVSTSLGNYYARRVATIAQTENVYEGKIRKWFTDELISPTGIRNMVLQEPGETSANLENRVIRALSDLVRAEQRGASTFYELTHDRLVEPILANNKKWEKDESSSLENYYAERVKAVAELNHVGEGKIRKWFTGKLITPDGIRSMVLQEPGGKSGGLENDIIQALGDLLQIERHGGATFYVLTGDHLVKHIIANNQKWFDERGSPLKRQAALWRDQNENESWLLSDQALIEVEQWAREHQDELTSVEMEFLEACQKQQEQILAEREAQRRELEMAQKLADEQARFAQQQALANQRIRKALRTSTVIAGIASLLLVVAIALGIQSYQNQRTTQMQVLINASSVEFNKGKTDLATLLAYQALKTYGNDHGEVEEALANIAHPMQEKTSFQAPFIIPNANLGVNSIAFNPTDGGQTFASGYSDGSIYLVDVATRQSIGQTLTGHTSQVASVAFSPDGKTLASGSYDSTIILWDVASHQPIGQPLTGHTDWVNSIAFSPDGKTLASGGDTNDRTIILWDVATHQQIGQPLMGHTYNVTSVAFSPDGKTLASGGGYDSTIILWDVATHQAIGQPLIGQTSQVTSVAFSPDGKMLASGGGYDATIIVWDVANHQAIDQLLMDDASQVTSVAFSPDGKTLASGGVSQSKITLWDVATRQPIGDPVDALVSNDITAVNALSLTADADILAVTGSNLILWDAESDRRTIGELNDELDNPAYHLESVANLSPYAFSPDGNYRVDGGSNYVTVSETATGREVAQMRQGGSSVTAVAFSHDGNYVVSARNNQTILIWEAHNGKKIARINHERGGDVSSVAFSPDGTRIVIAYGDEKSTVEIWDIQSLQKILVISNGQLENLGYTVVSSNRFTGNQGGQNVTEQDENEQVGNPVADVLYSPDGLFILYRNGVVDHWDIWPSRAELKTYAEGVCGTCELRYDQRLEYELYTWPMSVPDYAGYIILILNLTCYGFCIRTIYRSVFAKSTNQNKMHDRSWKKLLFASAQGALLILFSLLTWVFVGFFELIFYPDTTRAPDETILWLLLFTLLLGLWAGGAYSHFTRLESGKWSRTKRSLMGMLSGFLGGLLAGFLGIVAFGYVVSGGDLSSIFSDSEFLIFVLIIGGTVGLMSLFGALIYIFWLYPWSEGKLSRKTIKDWLRGSPIKGRFQVWWVRGIVVVIVGTVLGFVLFYLDQGYLDADIAGIITIISLVLGAFGFMFYPHKSSYILTAILGGLGTFLWFPGLDSLPISLWFGLGSGFILSAIISRILHAVKKI